MKNLLLSIAFLAIALGANAQPFCQASFYYSLDPVTGDVYFYDDSYNTDSSMISVISWDWTINGMGYSYTSTLQNPIYNLPYGLYNVCLTIQTASSCTSVFCDSVFVGGGANPCVTNVMADVYPVTVPNGNDGAIDLTIVGGTAPYYVDWNTGATTEDIYGLVSGYYSASISSSDSGCTPYYFSAYIAEPYDSTTYIDTLLVAPIDSCLGFVPDSFYIASISISGNNVTVTWVFTGGGMTATMDVVYTFSAYGPYMVVLSINCTSFKTMTTYTSYINIHDAVGISEENQTIGIYPNPVTDRLTINYNGNIEQVLIRNVNGSLIGTYETTDNTIDVSTLPEGVYFMQLMTGDGARYARFVKTR